MQQIQHCCCNLRQRCWGLSPTQASETQIWGWWGLCEEAQDAAGPQHSSHSRKKPSDHILKFILQHYGNTRQEILQYFTFLLPQRSWHPSILLVRLDFFQEFPFIRNIPMWSFIYIQVIYGRREHKAFPLLGSFLILGRLGLFSPIFFHNLAHADLSVV